ncbi:MAG: class I mannose-6-phosphate isomerase [Planctomycetia bacterium]|nr:class I mannose-6-phosphate isomerase [Planctomycetia bacterium]
MLYPLRVTPIYKTAIWGGRKIASLLNRKLPTGTNFAESWNVSGHPTGLSIIENGPLAGISLQEVLETHRVSLLGPHANWNFTRFPLMVKFLDANKQLSVQVHPNEEYVADRNLTDAAKAEAWVVLDTVPGSRMTLGFQRPVTREEVADALENDALEEILFAREPSPGECYFLPAGTVHSLGAGIFLYEVQQCSNLTFRLYDWQREDENGNRRELHITQALETLKPEHWNSEPITPQKQDACREILIESPAFCLDRLTFSPNGNTTYTLSCAKSCRVLTLISGELEVENLEKPLQKGDSVILPASLGNVTLKSTQAVVLDAYLPQIQEEN